MTYLEVACQSCGAENVIRHFHATRTDPGFPERDTCEVCDAGLDFADAEPAEAPAPDPDALNDFDR
jgi:hypothetical protein